MQHLEERVLGVGARLAPDHRRGRKVDALAVERHGLAVALHLELLQIGGQPREALVVGQHGERRQIEEGAVPGAEQAHAAPADCARTAPSRKCRSIFAAPARKCREVLAAEREFRDKPDRRPNRVAAADPIPHREAARPARCRTRPSPRHWSTPRRNAPAGDRSPSAPTIQSRAAWRIGLRLLRGERLGADDRPASRPGRGTRDQIIELRAVDVRDEMRRDPAAPLVHAAPRRPAAGRDRSRRCRC